MINRSYCVYVVYIFSSVSHKSSPNTEQYIAPHTSHMSDSFLVAVLVTVSIIISVYQFITIVL